MQKVNFLEYVIWLSEIIQNSQKTKIVINWLRFTKLKKIQTFLDLMNYYWQYVAQHSYIMKFLTHLMHKNKKFHWKTEQEKIFVNFKATFTEMMQLQISQSEYDKKIEADASDFIVNSNLYQIKNNQQRLIIFWSWKLIKFKERYKIHNKELLVIVELLKK